MAHSLSFEEVFIPFAFASEGIVILVLLVKYFGMEKRWIRTDSGSAIC